MYYIRLYCRQAAEPPESHRSYSPRTPSVKRYSLPPEAVAEIVQRENRKRKCKNKEPHLFAVLVKCYTCEYSLSLSPNANGNNFLTCITYKKKGKEACSMHYISCNDLYNVVLMDIRRQIKFVLRDEKKVAEKLKRIFKATLL